MSYEVDVLAPWLPERRFQSASPCSDPNPKHPSMASSFEGRHGQQIYTGRAIIWEQLHKTFSSSLLLGAFVCLFLFALLFSISPLLWAFQPCHPGPSLTQILSKPTPSRNAFLRLGAAQGGWQSKLSVPEALSSVPGTNKLTSTSHCLPLQSPSSLQLHSFLS